MSPKAAHRVLVLERDPQEGAFIASALKPVVSDVVVESNNQILSNDFDLLIANLDQLNSDQLSEIFGTCRAAGTPLLLCSRQLDRTDFVDLFGERGVTNLLGKNPGLDPDELRVTTQKLLGSDIFGLGQYFHDGANITRDQISRASDRARLVEAARELAVASGARRRMVELFVTVADELVSNAVFNAPADSEGRPLYAHLSRLEEVELPKDRSVTMSLYCDGDKLGISAEDRYGTISVSGIQEYLCKGYRRESDQVDRKKGGAGIGLYYVFRSLSHFVVNLEPGKRTEVIGLLDIRGRFRDFVARQKSFNVFVNETA